MVEMKIELEPWPWPKSLGSKGIEEMYAPSPRAYSRSSRVSLPCVTEAKLAHGPLIVSKELFHIYCLTKFPVNDTVSYSGEFICIA